MDKITKSDVQAIVTEELEKRGITRTEPGSLAGVLSDIEKSNLSESAKQDLTRMLTDAEKLSKAASQRSITSPSTGPAAAKIEQLAKEFITKSGKPIDLAIARSEVRKLHPELAQQERDEYRHF